MGRQVQMKNPAVITRRDFFALYLHADVPFFGGNTGKVREEFPMP